MIMCMLSCHDGYTLSTRTDETGCQKCACVDSQPGGMNPMFPGAGGSGSGGCTGPFCMGVGNGGSGGTGSGGWMMGGPGGVGGKYLRSFLLLFLLAGHEIRHRLSYCDVIESRIAAGRGISGKLIHKCPLVSPDLRPKHTKISYTVTII
ncbi:loricrin-like [Dreissena polymorpha]|uniref:loricrin-like n=1 Tax=Dreissena polymorpha TaxID=45954 RepID=UPI002264E5DE|nr:loricrin-like [Dreissena polymorpha]